MTLSLKNKEAGRPSQALHYLHCHFKVRLAMPHPVDGAIGAATDLAFINQVVRGELKIRLLTRHVQITGLRQADARGAEGGEDGDWRFEGLGERKEH